MGWTPHAYHSKTSPTPPDLNRHDMNALAAAGALASISGHRRQAMWDVTGIEPRPPVLRDAPIPDPAAQLTTPHAKARTSWPTMPAWA